MKPQVRRQARRLNPFRPFSLFQRGYFLTEALVYISAVGLLLTVGLIAMFRCIDSSLVLRRNADDIARAMHIGELWRADIRSATKVRWVQDADEDILQLVGPGRQVQYRFTGGALYRRIGSGPWGRLLEQVKASAMHSETQSEVTAWHWDLELQPRFRGSVAPTRMRPLFTFIAVPHPAEKP